MQPSRFRSALSAACLLPGLVLGFATSGATADNPCDEDHITLRLVRAEWRDTCAATPCPVLTGTGSFEHACPVPIGVRVRLRALDVRGEAVVVSEMWPFGRRNVAAGVHEFSIDQWIGHDAEIAGFELIAVGVTRWPDAP